MRKGKCKCIYTGRRKINLPRMQDINYMNVNVSHRLTVAHTSVDTPVHVSSRNNVSVSCPVRVRSE